MPETYREKISRILRDHQGYTGDGQGGVGALPVGDRSTARKPIEKRDVREALLDFADVAESAADSAIEAALYDPSVRFKTVPDMLASNRAGKGAGTIWQADGYRYEEVTSDHHLTTAGGVKLKVLPGADGSVSILAFGIGSSGDQSAALQAAFSSGIAKIHGTATTYDFASALTVSAAKEVVGLRLKYTGPMADKAISVTAHDVSWRRFRVDGNSLCLKPIWADGVDDLDIQYCRIHGAFSDGSLGLTSLSAWAVGVMVQGDSKRTIIENNIIYDITATWDGTAVEKDNSTTRGVLFVVAGASPSGMSVRDNSIYKLTGSSGVGVHLLGALSGGYYGGFNFTIDGNVIEGVTNRALKIQASFGSVTNNKHLIGTAHLSDFLTTHSLGGMGDFFNAKSNCSVINGEHVAVSGNQWLAQGYTANMLLDTCRYTTGIGNTSDNTAGRTTGVASCYTLTSCDGCLYSGNIGIGSDRGLYVLGGSTGCDIMGNRFVSPSEAGVYMEAASHANTVTDNKLSGTGTPLGCVYNNGCNHCDIARNKSFITNIPAVYMTGTAEGCQISENRAQSTTAALAVTFAGTTASKNGSQNNDRFNRLYEVTSWPISYGKYNAGDVIKVRTGTPGDYLLYTCRFGGEYGVTADPIWAKTAQVVA